MASGSFGPTTAGRMDSDVDVFQSLGGSKIMIAKGNRSQPRRVGQARPVVLSRTTSSTSQSRISSSEIS